MARQLKPLFVCLFFLFYNTITILLYPALLMFYIIRVCRGKDTLYSFWHKMGFNSIFSLFSHYDIWLHAASVGEIKSLEFILEQHKDKKILITTTTVKSRDIVLGYKKPLITHKFLPFDILPILIIFFIKNLCKNIIIAESEVWPNFYLVLRLFKKNTLLFNARFSKRSQEKWRKYAPMFRFIISSCKCVIAQSQSSYTFVKEFHPNTQYFGNLKMLNLHPITKIDETISKFIQHSQKPILCIASTHEGEDELIIKAIKDLNGYNLIYVPRHPHRAKDISKLLFEHGITNELYSSFTSQSCIVIDRVGILFDILSCSKTVIFGGSFLSHLKGHNIMEAAYFECNIITGYFVETFAEIIDEMKQDNAIVQCDSLKITESIKYCEENNIGVNAKSFIEKSIPDTKQITREINTFLDI